MEKFYFFNDTSKSIEIIYYWYIDLIQNKRKQLNDLLRII